LKEYCQTNKGFKYVDVASAMVDEKGAVFTDIFVQDNLHMNAKGYEIWKQVLRDQVMGDCNCGEDLE
jgi:lysophospholipase L1-like esterase